MTERKDTRFEIRLPTWLLAELDRAAKDLRTSRSHIARLSIESYLSSNVPKKRKLRKAAEERDQ